MILPSIRMSFCSKSQIWMRAFCSTRKLVSKAASTAEERKESKERGWVEASTYALEEPEDEVDGLGHDTLDLGGRHGCGLGCAPSTSLHGGGRTLGRLRCRER